MQPLSKEAETRLLSAIEQAAELVNSGESPNNAIIKIAGAANIPAGHINLMVHAYNTGRTTKQRESGVSVTEKAADFNLADVDIIMDALYPKAVKTAAEITSSSVISTEYAVSPVGFLARRKSVMEKAAAALIAMPEKTWVAPPRDEHAAVMRDHSKKQAEKRAVEELRRVATVAYSKAAAAMDDLANYFRTPGNMSFGDAVRQAGLRIGPEGVSVLTKLASVYPWLEKQAATLAVHRLNAANSSAKSKFGDSGPCDLIETVIEKLAEYKDYQAKFNGANPTKQAKAEKPEPITGSILFDPLEVPLDLKKANASPTLPLGPVSATHALGQTMAEGLNSYIKAPTQLRNEALADITDPDHERKLKNIRAQSVLADLIVNDPVISGHDPREVTTAFNELAEVAPTFMDSSATVQALLRKRLEAGQLADFDLKQLVELEKIKADQQKSLVDTQIRKQELLR
jgi:hypothetical protein